MASNDLLYNLKQQVITINILLLVAIIKNKGNIEQSYQWQAVRQGALHLFDMGWCTNQPMMYSVGQCTID